MFKIYKGFIGFSGSAELQRNRFAMGSPPALAHGLQPHDENSP